MPVSLLEDSSLLGVNVGASTTHAVLFDVVDGQYRFIALGQAPSTVHAPINDISLGVHQAISELQKVTGNIFIDDSKQLIKPAQLDGSGIDAFVATMSAGPTLRAVVVGLLPDVSIESAHRLAHTAYLQVVETIGLNDHRRPYEQIDAILSAQPDVIILTGGTDGGASRSILKIIESVGLACFLMPKIKRPTILFAGNQSLTESVKESLQNLSPSLRFSPNIRPSLATEDLAPAARELGRIFSDVRKRQMSGVDQLDAWTGERLLPSAYSKGRIIRFLSQINGSGTGILAVDLDQTAAIIAAGFNGKLSLSVYPQFGLGENLPGLLNYTKIENIMHWLHLDVAPTVVRDYLYQRSLYPDTIPVTKEDHAIVQAISREALSVALKQAISIFPPEANVTNNGMTPFFEPILVGGGICSESPTPGQTLLLLLDALQPVGITSIILDQNNLLPLLGAAAESNNLLPVHVLESGAFMSLGTIISVISSASYGTRVLRANLTYEDGSNSEVEVKFGEIEILPLGIGQTARLSLQTFSRSTIGKDLGRNSTLQVVGGVIGVVIDARGRPLSLPEDPAHRREMFNSWLSKVEG